MSKLVFIGLGLWSERSLSLRGVEEAKKASVVFAELYTSFIPELKLSKLEELIGKKITLVSRRDLEEENGKKILKEAEVSAVAILVPGDPFIATTHVDLRIRAEKRGIETSVVHGASIVSAVIGLSGLQNYKFGRSVTIPFLDSYPLAETPYKAISENQKANLHTLCFLDVSAEKEQYMTIYEGLRILLAVEKLERKRVITADTLAVGIARAGSNNPKVKADKVGELLRFDFNSPPHTLVFPGRLHFMEAEALITLARAPTCIREMVK